MTVASVLVACGDSEGLAIQSATPTVSPSATPTVEPSVAGAMTLVTDVDFTDPAVVGPIIDHFGGGQIEPLRIEFVDLTHDGKLDAFVIVESGGTMGDLGAALVGLDDQGLPQVLGYVDSGGRVDLRFPDVGGGIVVTTEGVWEPDDASCCPSQLNERTWEWRDRAFVLIDEQVVDNPDMD
ncbi:MAG: hypothetical protein O2924_04420 [Chloroflexi bacterium]|nr:hypothetical protein [Chloroflexota bacterium]